MIILRFSWKVNPGIFSLLLGVIAMNSILIISERDIEMY